ncbi:MAG: aconitase X catalytic domain-containing protein [Actinomycetota bacterium]|nr:aconitase X catalytic domain-containing protein [Actinomycetota bacterium]
MLELEDRDRGLLAGSEGEGRRIAMRILLRLAELQRAPRFIDVTRAHIDGCIYTGEAIVRFARKLAENGSEVAVPTTTNVISVDLQRWRAQQVPREWADNARRLADAYLQMGARPTFTCAPYDGPEPPVRGEHIAWAESNAIAYANGVLGARTNRYGDLIDACAALTGRVPLSGYHLDTERLATVLIDIRIDVDHVDESFWPVLGYIVGEHCGDQVPVVAGAPRTASRGELKAFAAAAATSGAVGMFHIVGVTPEAATVEDAIGGVSPRRRIEVTSRELRDAWIRLSASDGRPLGCVALGSPHLSLDECRLLAHLVGGQQCATQVDFCLTTSTIVHEAAQRLGLADVIERFGARFITDTCVLNSPVLPASHGVLMTNSAKYAHYAPGILGRDVVFGSTEDCVRSAVEGQPLILTPAWAA